MFADILCIALGADAAFFNGGTIRSDQVGRGGGGGGDGRTKHRSAAHARGRRKQPCPPAPAPGRHGAAAPGGTPRTGSLAPPRPLLLQVHAAGQLVMRDFVSMLPFTDELVLLELTGEQLLRSLETGVGSWPKLEGRFLQARLQWGTAQQGAWRARSGPLPARLHARRRAHTRPPPCDARCLASALLSTPTSRPARACCKTL